MNKTLDFDIMLDQVSLDSYNAIIYNRNQLEYIQNEVRKLDKAYNELKKNTVTNDLDEYLDKVEEINGIKVLLYKSTGLDVTSLKSICDALANKLDNSFIMFANINGDNINFVARSNSKINAGMIVKKSSVESNGNGGGSPTFAQGGGRSTENLDSIFESIKEEIKM